MPVTGTPRGSFTPTLRGSNLTPRGSTLNNPFALQAVTAVQQELAQGRVADFRESLSKFAKENGYQSFENRRLGEPFKYDFRADYDVRYLDQNRAPQEAGLGESVRSLIEAVAPCFTGSKSTDFGSFYSLNRGQGTPHLDRLSQITRQVPESFSKQTVFGDRELEREVNRLRQLDSPTATAFATVHDLPAFGGQGYASHYQQAQFGSAAVRPSAASRVPGLESSVPEEDQFFVNQEGEPEARRESRESASAHLRRSSRDRRASRERNSQTQHQKQRKERDSAAESAANATGSGFFSRITSVFGRKAPALEEDSLDPDTHFDFQRVTVGHGSEFDSAGSGSSSTPRHSAATKQPRSFQFHEVGDRATPRSQKSKGYLPTPSNGEVISLVDFGYSKAHDQEQKSKVERANQAVIESKTEQLVTREDRIRHLEAERDDLLVQKVEWESQGRLRPDIALQLHTVETELKKAKLLQSNEKDFLSGSRLSGSGWPVSVVTEGGLDLQSPTAASKVSQAHFDSFGGTREVDSLAGSRQFDSLAGTKQFDSLNSTRQTGALPLYLGGRDTGALGFGDRDRGSPLWGGYQQQLQHLQNFENLKTAGRISSLPTADQTPRWTGIGAGAGARGRSYSPSSVPTNLNTPRVLTNLNTPRTQLNTPRSPYLTTPRLSYPHTSQNQGPTFERDNFPSTHLESVLLGGNREPTSHTSGYLTPGLKLERQRRGLDRGFIHAEPAGRPAETRELEESGERYVRESGISLYEAQPVNYGPGSGNPVGSNQYIDASDLAFATSAAGEGELNRTLARLHHQHGQIQGKLDFLNLATGRGVDDLENRENLQVNRFPNPSLSPSSNYSPGSSVFSSPFQTPFQTPISSPLDSDYNSPTDLYSNGYSFGSNPFSNGGLLGLGSAYNNLDRYYQRSPWNQRQEEPVPISNQQDQAQEEARAERAKSRWSWNPWAKVDSHAPEDYSQDQYWGNNLNSNGNSGVHLPQNQFVFSNSQQGPGALNLEHGPSNLGNLGQFNFPLFYEAQEGSEAADFKESDSETQIPEE